MSAALVKMKIVSWNINGIRTFRNAVKKTLDSFEADVICVQETKVTRDLLDERTAIVDGYNSYFSFSKGRSGYSGVATFCKDSATPFAAEEGLTGLLASNDEAIGCYGDQKEFSSEELQSLDNEGRAVITRHHINTAEGPKVLTIVNVYCPRADPEKPERKIFKLQFYKLLQSRAEALLASGSHVIVLGDVNTSHRPIDHCDPDDIESFEDNPGRRWLDGFLFGVSDEEQEHDQDLQDAVSSSLQPNGPSGGKFVDTFRFLHPSRAQAFTCWSTLTGARQTNYGTRIDYVFADRTLAESFLEGADIMPEVEGSDHCPIWAHLGCGILPSARCPPLCTRHMPEFAGRQQKLSRFLVKMTDAKGPKDTNQSGLPGSQESQEIRENLNPVVPGSVSEVCRKRGSERMEEALKPKGKKTKVSKVATANPQGSLLAFFKPKGPLVVKAPKDASVPACCTEDITVATHGQNCCDGRLDKIQGSNDEASCRLTNGQVIGNVDTSPLINYNNLKGLTSDPDRTTIGTISQQYQPEEGEVMPPEGGRDTSKGVCPSFWKTVLRGPPQPPPCKVHGEPCVLRTVKKAGPNMGRQFFVCARPQGHASNPQARCNFFAWVEKGK